jgi:phosphoglycolate phosphatase
LRARAGARAGVREGLGVRVDVLLDLDGTLIDPRPGLIGSIQYALGKLGRTVPAADELLWMIGPPFRVSFPRLLGTDAFTEDAIAHYRERYFSGGMYDAMVYDGIPEALDVLLASGCRLFVATAKPHFYARPILQHFGLAGRFAGIYGPELDGRNDHKADLIAHIMQREAVGAGSAVMVGDREMDVSAAARNGMRALGVTWGYGGRAELAAAGAAAICESPGALAAAVLGFAPAATALAAVGDRDFSRSNCRTADDL